MLRNGSWFVIGGMDYSGAILASTEILAKNQFVPSLIWPEAVLGHCMAQFNSSHVFIAGGEGEDSKLLDTSYFLNVDIDYWYSPEEALKHPRKGHVCGFAKDASHEWNAVVAGGFENLIVEVLSFSAMRWKLGPRLPFEMTSASSVQIVDSMHIIGGEHIGYCSKAHLCYSSDTVFKLELELDLWNRLVHTMDLPRSKFVSITLPSNLGLCQKVCENCTGVYTEGLNLQRNITLQFEIFK